ncbi:MAG: TMEM175 family protein [Bacteroidota bacterium]
MLFSHNSSRVQAFSDAVFAFAATLLVFSFDMGSDFAFSRDTVTGFLCFFVGFFVLVGLWWVHYNFFRRTAYLDNGIIALNCVLLFVVLYYVFPLKELIKSWMGTGAYSRSNLAQLFVSYGLGFTLLFLCLALMYWRAKKGTTEAENTVMLHFYSRHFAIFVLVGALSVALALLQVGIQYGLPGITYFLIGPLCYWHSHRFFKNRPHEN